MKTFNGKPVHLDDGRYLQATIAAIGMTDLRTGLIEIYRAAKKYYGGQGIEFAAITLACQERAASFQDFNLVKNAKS